MNAVPKENTAASQKLFLETLNGAKTSCVPVWFMRQAGRYLPEYRELRAQKGGFLEMAMDPGSACEVTMQPIRRFGMDAAIIFSDILVIPYALGQKLEFVKGEGPKLDPILNESDLSALSTERFEEKLAPVYEALRQTSSALKREGHGDTALIGFAGAPWTVATYMVEGGSSRDFAHVKAMAYGHPAMFTKLMDMLVEHTAAYLVKQVEAGAEAVQLFDSWAGALAPDQFRRWSIEPAAEIVRRFKQACPGVPFIGFPKGAGVQYETYIAETVVDAAGLDTTVPTKWAAEKLQPHVPVQGNLDPFCLLAGGDVMASVARDIMDDLSGGPFVFNLGHGINKETPPEHVERLVKIVRDYKR